MVLENLSPTVVWKIFEEVIASTPRPSNHEEKIRKKIRDWLSEQIKILNIGLELVEDKVGNIFIKKPATKGMESCSSILLQAHLDMICETDRPDGYNFHELGIPIRIQENNEWVDADGTTLGADNGIGVALALALLVDIENNTSHGPIEVLLTVNEEAGFTGATNLDVKTFNIKSKLMINLDSGSLGEITIGSVCGRRVYFSKEFEWKDKNSTEDLTFIELKIGGLLSGHSGGDIHLPRGSANKLISRILSSVSQEIELYLCNWNGGTRTNVIAREGVVKFAINSTNRTKCENLLNAEISTVYKFYKNENNPTFNFEPHLQITWNNSDSDDFLSLADTKNVITTSNLITHGVLRFSPFYENTTETSNNFAIVKRKENRMLLRMYPRSIYRSELDSFVNSMVQLGEMGDWQTTLYPVLPEWAPDLESTFLKFVKTQYETLLKQPVKTKVIHGGLETGMISKKIPGIQMIALCPTIIGNHSPSEKLKIFDVRIIYDLLIRILKNLPDLD
jgi:dipeptidase D